MKNYPLFFTFLLLSLTLFSQTYQVLDTTDFQQRTDLVKNFENNFKTFKKQLRKKHKGKIRKQVEKSYENIHKGFVKDIRKKKLIFNPEFTSYINDLSSEIIKSNPELASKNIKVYISRHISPNALSLGNGVIIVNMGLFKYLENEAQLASVISHEMAHQQLNHTENSILYKAKLNTSKKSIRQTKEIKRQRCNQQDKAFEILKKLLYTNSKNHRKHEVEADSLGYELYKKTKYPKQEFLNTLKVMAELDSLPVISLKKGTYKAVFNTPNQPFKEEWLKQEDFSSYNYNHYKEKINKDSVKSHPEMVERIAKLKTLFPETLVKTNNSFDNNLFKKLQNISRKEDVPNLYYLKNYGLSVYLALYRLQRNPNNEYYKNWIGKNFSALHDAKKRYQFNRYIDRLNPKDQDKSYQQFLAFMWNLRLEEFKNIAEFYSEVKK